MLLQNIHVSFLRTVPPYSHQADVWVELLRYFNYIKVIFIHSSDSDGRSLLGRFQSTSQILQEDTEFKIQVGEFVKNSSLYEQIYLEICFESIGQLQQLSLLKKSQTQRQNHKCIFCF